MEVYAIDAGALIDIQRHFPTQFKKLGRMAEQGQIKIPEGIFRELKRKSDQCSKTVERWVQKSSKCLVQVAHVHNLASELARIEQQYGEKIVVGTNTTPAFGAVRRVKRQRMAK